MWWCLRAFWFASRTMGNPLRNPRRRWSGCLDFSITLHQRGHRRKWNGKTAKSKQMQRLEGREPERQRSRTPREKGPLDKSRYNNYNLFETLEVAHDFHSQNQ